MQIVTDWQLNPIQYFQEAPKKKHIYLHHTVGGTARSSFEYWNGKTNKVATAYLVERDGTIYQVFDPKYWAWHLGLKSSNNTIANKQSIGIEIASEGALRAGFEFNAIRKSKGLPPKFDENFLYCFDVDPDSSRKPEDWFNHAKKLYNIDTDNLFFTQMVNTWRGYDFFDQYDEPQVQGVTELVKYLCETFSIPKQIIDGDRNRFEPALIDNFSGILTHCNVRQDKTDVHLNFPWDRLKSFINS